MKPFHLHTMHHSDIAWLLHMHVLIRAFIHMTLISGMVTPTEKVWLNKDHALIRLADKAKHASYSSNS